MKDSFHEDMHLQINVLTDRLDDYSEALEKMLHTQHVLLEELISAKSQRPFSYDLNYLVRLHHPQIDVFPNDLSPNLQLSHDTTDAIPNHSCINKSETHKASDNHRLASIKWSRIGSTALASTELKNSQLTGNHLQTMFQVTENEKQRFEIRLQKLKYAVNGGANRFNTHIIHFKMPFDLINLSEENIMDIS